jgi:hypothetical protein
MLFRKNVQRNVIPLCLKNVQRNNIPLYVIIKHNGITFRCTLKINFQNPCPVRRLVVLACVF